MSTPSSQHLHRRLAALAAIAAAAALALAACGGGGSDSGGVAAAQGASFQSGTITGFGSVIVNGVRYDDSGADVSDDDGARHSRDDLKLGMSVEVHGGPVAASASGASQARADGIVFGAAVVGPTTSIDVAAGRLLVLGQTVVLTDTTVLDDRLAGGIAALPVGGVVEVHGRLDVAAGTIVATRVEPKTAPPSYRVRGIVAGLDAASKAFSIGAARISYAGFAQLPAGFADGLLVRVRLQTAPVAGTWIATAVDSGRPHVEDADEAELKGTITAFVSTTSFSVAGIPVDASAAAFPDGTSGIALGASVEVEGRAVDGVVVARKVEIEDHEEEHAEGFELHGSISAIDTAARRLVVRDVTVDYAAPGVEFRDGSEAMLAVGVRLEVRGTLSADRTVLRASRIEFEN